MKKLFRTLTEAALTGLSSQTEISQSDRKLTQSDASTRLKIDDQDASALRTRLQPQPSVTITTMARFIIMVARSSRAAMVKTTVLLTLALSSLHLSAAQSLETIVAAAERHALNLATKEHLDNARATAGRMDPRLQLSQCTLPLSTFDNLMGPLGQRLTVGVRCEGPKPWTVYVPVKVEASMTVVTLRTSLPRGTLLQTHHLAVTQKNRRATLNAPLSSINQAIGQELTRSVGHGVPLTTSMIKKPNLVTKGDSVMMIIQRGSIRVSMVGEALESGALGQRIKLNNINSNRAVEGEIQRDGTIRVL